MRVWEWRHTNLPLGGKGCSCPATQRIFWEAAPAPCYLLCSTPLVWSPQPRRTCGAPCPEHPGALGGGGQKFSPAQSVPRHPGHHRGLASEMVQGTMKSQCCTPVLVCPGKSSSCSLKKVFPSLEQRLFLKMYFSVKIRKFPSSFPSVCKKYYSQKAVVHRVWFWIYSFTIMLSHILKACL